MPTVAIDLNSVQERPRLPAGQPFVFQFLKAEAGIAKNVNKTTQRQEGVIKCELAPIDPEWSDRKVYHTFSLSPGALASDDPTFSIKKFFTTVGFSWGPNGEFSTEDLMTIKFVGEARYEEGNNFPRLAKVIQGA